MEEYIFDELLDVTELAVVASDFDDDEDVEMILGLLECLEDTDYWKEKRAKRLWVKDRRGDRMELDSYSFLMNDLSGEITFLNYMTPATFDFIATKIGDDIKKQDTLMRKSISPTDKLAATLRYIATGESYNSSNFQNVISDSLLCVTIPEICDAIWKHFKDDFLKFPSTKREWEVIADNFESKWQFPNCLGVLDAKHMISKPICNIVLLALVDADCRFVYIDVENGAPNGEAQIFLQSDLKKTIDNAEECFPAHKLIGNYRRILPYVIIGNDTFPLQKHVMTSYSHKTSKKRRKIFNIRLARARRVAQQAFEILSQRFRILQNKIYLSPGKVVLVAKTCCVLHNLLSYKNENYLNDLLAIEKPTSALLNSKRTTLNSPVDGAAQYIRQQFEEYFINEGKLDWQENELC